MSIDLRFPIGEYDLTQPRSASDVAEGIEAIAALPAELRAAVDGLSDAQLDTPYRPDGWTVRQVVHHLADSHMHSYIRFKRVLTEDNPEILGYDEARWAEFEDASRAPIGMSLDLVDALHGRWTRLLRSLSDDDRARTFQHSEYGALSLNVYIPFYGWHCKHHVAHITALREREGW